MALIDELTQKDLLTRCWKHVCANKPKHRRITSRGIDNISIKQFADNHETYLEKLYKRLCESDFKLDRLKGVSLEKPGKDKDRLLSVPTVADRIIHKAIFWSFALFTVWLRLKNVTASRSTTCDFWVIQ